MPLDRTIPPSAAIRRYAEPEALPLIRKPFENLAKRLLQRYPNNRMTFVMNGGNFGDALIHYGAMRFFEDLGTDIRFVKWGMRSRGSEILAGLRSRLPGRRKRGLVISGSGGWCKVYRDAEKTVERCSRIGSEVVVLPTTFGHESEPLANVDYFARDQFESMRNMPDAEFCHDSAFYLALVSQDRLLPNRTPPTRGMGILLRTDVEKGYGGDVPACNRDISAEGYTLSDPQEFLRRIDEYEEVLTDRLHIAIGAALLGKPVKLMASSYFKIPAIYKTSIKPVFPHCEMISDAEGARIMAAYRDVPPAPPAPIAQPVAEPVFFPRPQPEMASELADAN